MLWITGSPGSGKTYVSAHMVQQSVYHHPTAYFFCNTQDEAKRSAISIFRTWAWQLLQTGAFDIDDEITESYRLGLPITLSNISRILKLLSQQEGAAWLILDGLDECFEEDQQDVLKLCGKLSKAFKIVIVSREEKDIGNGLTNALGTNFVHMKMTLQDTEKDILSY